VVVVDHAQVVGRRRALTLQALPARYGAPLCRFERHRRLYAARRTFGARLRARQTSCRRPSAWFQGRAGSLGLAWLAALRVVLELLVEEKELFPRGEDKLTTTICGLSPIQIPCRVSCYGKGRSLKGPDREGNAERSTFC
jgi:hypothetical protein